MSSSLNPITRHTDDLRLAAQWREAVAGGEMIQSSGYTREHLILPGASVREAYAISLALNAFYAHLGRPLRVKVTCNDPIGLIPTTAPLVPVEDPR